MRLLSKINSNQFKDFLSWAFYNGDINQDANIDLLDLNNIEYDINVFQFGYQASDVNGDGNVDLLDLPLIEDNINQFVFSIHP